MFFSASCTFLLLLAPVLANFTVHQSEDLSTPYDKKPSVLLPMHHQEFSETFPSIVAIYIESVVKFWAPDSERLPFDHFYEFHCLGVVWNAGHILTSAECLKMINVLRDVKLMVFFGYPGPPDPAPYARRRKAVHKFVDIYNMATFPVSRHSLFALIHLDEDISLGRWIYHDDRWGGEAEGAVSCLCGPKSLDEVMRNNCRVIGWWEQSYKASFLSKGFYRHTASRICPVFATAEDCDPSCQHGADQFQVHYTPDEACTFHSAPLFCQTCDNASVFALVGIQRYQQPGVFVSVKDHEKVISAKTGDEDWEDVEQPTVECPLPPPPLPENHGSIDADDAPPEPSRATRLESIASSPPSASSSLCTLQPGWLLLHLLFGLIL